MRALLLTCVACVACASGALAACTTASSPGGDAGALPLGPGAAYEQPADVYPAHHAPIPLLDFHGGPRLDHVSLVTVTFAGDAQRDALRTFGDFVVASTWFTQAVGGLGIATGTSAAKIELADTFSGRAVTDADIQDYLRQSLDAGALPAPTSQSLYVFYFPESTSIALSPTFTSCSGFAAYHNATPVRGAPADAGALFVAYAVIARCNGSTGADLVDQLTFSASHEIAEAVTDPLPSDDAAYILTSDDAWPAPLGAGTSAGNENADLCFFAGHHRESGYALTRVWDNAAASASRAPCQPQALGSVFFGAAVRSDDLIVKGAKKTGYVTAPRGARTQVVAEFFSEAPLPNDAALYAGTDRGGADPSALGGLPGAITLALSRTHAHNGNALYLVVDVPPAAPVGNYRILLRAVLSQSDYNDWPVIVRVRDAGP